MRIKNGFFMREVAGKYVVVPVGAQTNEFKGMIQMNQTGAFLWKALERGSDRRCADKDDAGSI